MNNILLAIILNAALVLVHSTAICANGPEKLTILFSSNVKGELEACG